MSMIGLVSMDRMKSGAPVISLRLVTAAKSSMICFPTSAMLVPRPVISAENLAERRYSEVRTNLCFRFRNGYDHGESHGLVLWPGVLDGALKAGDHHADGEERPAQLAEKGHHRLHPAQLKQFHAHIAHNCEKMLPAPFGNAGRFMHSHSKYFMR